MLGLIGKKLGMTQTYDGSENLVPLTVLEVGPCPIVQVKDKDSDGYGALKVGFGETTPKRVTNIPHAYVASGNPTCFITWCLHR